MKQSHRDWGPASALAIAMENDDRWMSARWLRAMSAQLYGQGGIHVPYKLPSYVLRRRATYGGKKGRRAVQRLRRRGLGPVYMNIVATAPMQHWTLTL